MSFSNINRVVLVGRLTREPELRSLPSGVSVCSLRLACNGRRKDAGGEYREKPNYFSVSAFGAQAESVHRYMHRGSRMAIDGRLEWSEWETAEGQRRQAVDIVAERVEFLDSPGAQTPEDGAAGGDPGEEAGRELAGVGAGFDDDLVF